MVKHDHHHLEQARLWLAYLRESDRLASHIPPGAIKRIEARSDPEAEIETLIGPWMFVSKATRRAAADTLEWLVNVAREHVTQTGEEPALRLVSGERRGTRRLWRAATLFRS